MVYEPFRAAQRMVRSWFRCILWLQWSSVGFRVPRKPREKSCVGGGKHGAPRIRFEALGGGSFGTGASVPELGPEYRYPIWGTGTPVCREPNWGCVPVPNKGYRYTKCRNAFLGSAEGFCEGSFGQFTHGIFWLGVQGSSHSI